MKRIILILLVLSISCVTKTDGSLNSEALRLNDSLLLEIKTHKWLFAILNKVKEPQLTSSNFETYRFIKIGSLGSISSLRIINEDDKILIIQRNYWKYYDNKRVDSLDKERTKRLNQNDWRVIKNSLSQLNFWSLSVDKKENNHVLDGTCYIIEGYNYKENKSIDRNYHLTYRMSPSDTTIYKSIFNTIGQLRIN